MSKTTSNAIHELIKSLSKSEKRYFKVVSGRHTIGEENNYITLFDFIENQVEYNEEALFKHFEGAAFLNKFSITKSRLYEQVMKALTSYHSSSSLEAQIHRLIHSAEILYKKSLYQHAKKQLLSAEKLARKNDRFGLLIEISNLQKKLIETQGYSQTTNKELEKIKQEDTSYLAKLKFYADLWNIKSELFIKLNQKGKARTKAELDTYKNLIEELDRVTEEDAKSFDSEYLVNHINSAYHFAINKLNFSLENLLKNKELFKNTPNRIKQEPNVYFSILTNIIYIHSKQGNYKEALVMLKKLKTFPTEYKIDMNSDLEIKLFSSISSIEITLLVFQGQYQKAILLEPKLLEGFKKFNTKIAPLRKAYLNFKMAVAYFGLGEYSQSLTWINKILNNQTIDSKEDLFAFTQILNLLLHLELNHTDLLPYAIKSTQRFLKSRNRTYKFESVFLKYMNKIAKSVDQFEQVDILEKILAEIQILKQDTFEKEALDYFDFESWILSKLKNKSMGEIRQEKYQSFLK